MYVVMYVVMYGVMYGAMYAVMYGVMYGAMYAVMQDLYFVPCVKCSFSLTNVCGLRPQYMIQAAVRQLRERLAQSNAASASVSAIRTSAVGSEAAAGSNRNSERQSWEKVPSVCIAAGAHKYVLISAVEPSSYHSESQPTTTIDTIETTFFVTSKSLASYHRNVAEPFVNRLVANGYKDIRVTGGGRILLNPEDKNIEVYGHSYGFGLADHAKSKEVILADERYKDYSVSWSNQGYQSRVTTRITLKLKLLCSTPILIL